MKYLFAILLTAIVCFSSTYLVISFVAWDFLSIPAWQPFERFMFLLFGGGITAILSPIACLIVED